ncbi:ubiquitin carboxyl-terminal hydrolase [Enterocytozoon bieneusi H348]|nr:ubiquitin carboxyl-terminal hydrolase [Enterocytozoon bieneusi H348]|eukprot:XP_001827953.1 ubiquitin carboxyl-terminal hydrolase [Enterocytozoon bieneusi H348]
MKEIMFEKYIFTKIKEESTEFSVKGYNEKFKVNLNKNLVCIEFLSKIYKDTTYKIEINFVYQNMNCKLDFLFDFSFFNNTFVFDLNNRFEKNIEEINSEVPLTMTIYINKVKLINEYCGLANLGATCYINSLLQTIRYMYTFQKYLFNSNDAFYCLNLKRLFYSMSVNSTGVEYTLVKKFINNLEFVKNIHDHEDVHEFSKKLFDKLELENKSLIKNTIEGELVTIFDINCGCKLKKREPFQDISLNIKNTLIDAFNEFTSPEVIDEFTCEQHGKTCAKKKVMIEKTPKYLFILLNRFIFDWRKGDSVKDNSYCKYEEELDITEYIYDEENYANSKKVKSKSNTKYQLLSNIVHAGSISQGHFYCFIKIDNKYYKFNDECVTEAIKDEAIDWNYGGKNLFTNKRKHFSAYYLIYQRVDTNNDNLPFFLNTIPNNLVEEEKFYKIPIISNTLKTYFSHVKPIKYIGPGIYNANSLDYQKINLPIVTLSQFDNIKTVLKDSYIFQFKNNAWNQIQNKYCQDAELIACFNSCKYSLNNSKFVFIKIFINTIECKVYPEKLKLIKMVIITNNTKIEDLKEGFLNIYEENYLDNYKTNIITEINDIKTIKNGSILIITDSKKHIVEEYIQFLIDGRFIFIKLAHITGTIPIFIKRNLTSTELANQLKADLTINTLEFIFPSISICNKHDISNFNCNECLINEQNEIELNTNGVIYYIGSMFDKISIGSIPHIHPFIMELYITKKILVQHYIMCNHECIKSNNKKDFEIIHVFKNSPQVIFYKHDNDIIRTGGLIIFMNKIKNPMIICTINNKKEIINYPIIIEKVNTIVELRNKYMILNKIYKKNNMEIVECSENEDIMLQNKDYLMIEISQ